MHRRQSVHPQQAGLAMPGHGQAASLQHEFDVFLEKEAERVNQLREQWTQCSMEEWKKAGEGDLRMISIILCNINFGVLNFGAL